MSPRQLKVALCLFAMAVAGAFFMLPTGGSYVEYAPVDVATSVRPVATAPKASAVSPSAPAVANSVDAARQGPISLRGVTEAMTVSVKPVTSVQPAAQAEPAMSANPSSAAPAKSLFRPAFLASVAEREAAADAAGVPREDFVKACDRDHDLYVASAGHAPFYMCSGMMAPIGPDVTAITTTPSYPITETFKLHSRPTATRKIYLDFNGHTTTGTPWNSPPPVGFGRATFTTPAFSLDADTTRFSNAEHAAIQYVWRSIAEDYARFDVDVTTETQSVEAIRKISPTGVAYGVRVVFGPDQNATGAGGQAYVGSFDRLLTSADPDIPCFVYAGTGATAKFMAEAGSHEIGHTLGLYHDGTVAVGTVAALQYYPGHGSGATSWAPIMGVGYYKDVVQWSKGEYANANNLQDDLAVIGTYLPLADDDHRGTMATATVITGNTLSGGSLINGPTDVDMFKITAGRGNLVITPKVALVSPNLRMQIKVLKSDGSLDGTYDAVGTVGRMAPDPITYKVITDGTYYIQIDGIASGTGVSDGYSDYSSMGIYGLTASWKEPGNKPPVADATASVVGASPVLTYNYDTQPGAFVNFNGSLSYDPDGVITSYRWNFADVFPQTADGAIVQHRYLAPGVYKPTLTVTDDRGASASTMLTVTVEGPTKTKTFSVAQHRAGFVRVDSLSDAFRSTITLQDKYGNPMRSAVVYVRFSGILNAPAVMARTDVFGNVTVTSPVFKRGARGTMRVDIDQATSTTHTYFPADNLEPTFVIVTR